MLLWCSHRSNIWRYPDVTTLCPMLFYIRHQLQWRWGGQNNGILWLHKIWNYQLQISIIASSELKGKWCSSLAVRSCSRSVECSDLKPNWGICLIITEHFDGLVQDCSNTSTLAMESLQSCTKPSICDQVCCIGSRDKYYETHQTFPFCSAYHNMFELFPQKISIFAAQWQYLF